MHRFLLRIVAVGLLMAVGCAAADASPNAAQRAQYLLDHLPAGPDYRDPQTYAAAKAEFSQKIAEAQKSPERASAIARGLWNDEIKYSPIDPGYDPIGNARTAAALEAYIAILSLSPQSEPLPVPAPQPASPPKIESTLPPTGKPADERAEGAVQEILKGAGAGPGPVDINRFLPNGGNGGTTTNTATNTQTSAQTGTGAGGSFHGSHPANSSTITEAGVSSRYEPVTASAAQEIVKRYNSIPGGIVLEGGSGDLSFIKKVSYFAPANAFIINDDIVYISPVSAAHYLEIAAALDKDDRLGVSIGKKPLVFGALPKTGGVVGNLQLADQFLADIALAEDHGMKGYIFAPGYLSAVTDTLLSAVFFKFDGYRFSVDPSGILRRVNGTLETTFVPALIRPAPDGGISPDLGRIKSRKDIGEQLAANLTHLQDNIAYYARERIVRIAFAYGEAAAFARALKANHVMIEPGERRPLND